MKPSLERLRRKLNEKYESASEEKKEQIRLIAKSYGHTKAFQHDELLTAWWDRNCKGKRTSEIQPILQKGVDNGEITRAQAILVLDFLTEQGYLA